MLVTTDSIILRSRKQGDTSKIVSIYTLDFGMVDVIAKGAREMKSKFGSALEPFTSSKVSFYKKEGRDLYLLSNAEIITPLRNLQSDLEHIEAATRMVELLLQAQHHEESHPNLFRLVQTALQTLNSTSESKAVSSVLFSYYLKYLSFAGFAVKMDRMNRDSTKSSYFDIFNGSVIELQNDESENDRLVLLSPETVAALAHLERTEIQNSSQLRMSEQAIFQLNNLFRAYFAHHIEGMQRNRNKSGKVFSAMGKSK